jgi:hypothetical protein
MVDRLTPATSCAVIPSAARNLHLFLGTPTARNFRLVHKPGISLLQTLIITAMKLAILTLPLVVAATCAAKVRCPSPNLDAAAERVHSLQKQLEAIRIGEMETNVPAAARDGLSQLKDALSSFADAALTCVPLSADPGQLQTRFAQLLTANQTRPGQNAAANQASSPYGDDLTVHVSRPSNMPDLLQVEFSVNVECGDDHLLLLYAPTEGGWKEQIRWQAPPLKQVSDAFGDFFASALLPPSPGDGLHRMRLVVAHGKPWCTSRFSGFNVDVLSPSPTAKSPHHLWRTERGYSRGDFGPTLKTSADTFELRVDASTIDPMVYVRRVIYRYRIDDKQQVHRIEPIATNARGFVEEWLSAPWSESESFLATDATPELKQIHEQFQTSMNANESGFVTHSYGPVRACGAVGIFQVEINSTLQRIIPDKPGGDSIPQPAHFFHVREVNNGYLIISAPTAPDPACKGGDLMPNSGD